MTYTDHWARRPEAVDCHFCGGDLYKSGGVDNRAEPGLECCSLTGLDAMPWNELLMIGRKHDNGRWRRL